MADTINTLLTGIENSKDDIATSIEGKGVSVPSGTKLAGMSSLIDQISTMHGPASSVDGNLAAFDGTSGDTLKDSGIAMTNVATQTGNNTFSGSTTFTGSVTFDTSDNNVTFGGVAPTFGVGLNIGTPGSQAAPITFFDADNVIYSAQLALDGNRFVIQTSDNDGGTYGNILFPNPITSNVTLATTDDLTGLVHKGTNSSYVTETIYGEKKFGNTVRFGAYNAGAMGFLSEGSISSNSLLSMNIDAVYSLNLSANGSPGVAVSGFSFKDYYKPSGSSTTYTSTYKFPNKTASNKSYTIATTDDLTGFVFGPNSVTADGNIAIYDGTTGKIIKDSGIATDLSSTTKAINITGSPASIKLAKSDGNYVEVSSSEGVVSGETGIWHYITDKISNNTYYHYLPRKTGVLATLDDIDELLIDESNIDLGFVSLGGGYSANSSAPTTPSTHWTVEMFDAVNALTSTTINYTLVNGGMSGTSSITRETYLGYPALNFNLSGPYYIAYKYNNQIYVYSYATEGSFDLQINSNGTETDIYEALSGSGSSADLTTHAFTAQASLNLMPKRSYTSGLQISTSLLDDYKLYVPVASTSQSGVVSTGNQVFLGQKTFNSKVVVGNPSNYSATVILEVGKVNSYNGGFSFTCASAGSAGSMSGVFNNSASSYPEINNIKQIKFSQGNWSTHSADTYSTTLISSAAPSANITLTLPNKSGTLGFAIDVVDLR